MAQNVTIAGASYSDVPAIDVPKTGGGTAKFVDTTDANATAPDIQSGKTAYVNGQKVTGTGTSGGAYRIVQTISGDKSSLAITDAGTFTLQDKTVTENGTVTADSGYDGLGTVTVNVSGGGMKSGGRIWKLNNIIDMSQSFSAGETSVYVGEMSQYEDITWGTFRVSFHDNITYWTMKIGESWFRGSLVDSTHFEIQQYTENELEGILIFPDVAPSGDELTWLQANATEW